MLLGTYADMVWCLGNVEIEILVGNNINNAVGELLRSGKFVENCCRRMLSGNAFACCLNSH